MAVLEKIQEKAEEMKRWRRHIHARPELAFNELETSDFIAERLKEFGIEVHRGMAQTAVIGILHGKSGPGGRAVALRADMDALPMQENNTFDHCSQHPGKMHGCGHDGHSAMLLGAAEYLSEHTDSFDGTLYFIFQPAEEDQGGADHMVREGFFDKYPCEAIYGLHNWPGLESGKMAVRAGAFTANCDEFSIKIRGKGGHAAWPHYNADVVTAGAAIVTNLQTLVSRRLDPLHSAVVSVCIFQAGTAKNVMPDEALVGGTVRSFGEEDRMRLKAMLEDMTGHTAAAYGVEVDITYELGYPSVVNSAAESALAAEAMRAVVGDENVEDDFPPAMGAEDFAYFLQHKPGAYAVIGQETPEKNASLHSPRYDFNDDIAPIGASYWVKLAQLALPV